MTNEDKRKTIEALDALHDEAAHLDAKETKITPEVRAWADGVRERMQVRLAELRRGLVAAAPEAPKAARPIRPGLLAMAHDALIAHINGLLPQFDGPVQIAHRHLSGLSDDDLRRLAATLEAELEAEK